MGGVYYTLVFFLAMFYVVFSGRCGIRLYSFSNMFFILVFLMVGLPGYYVSEGTIDSLVERRASGGMNWQLYWIYLYSFFSAVFGLMLGSLAIRNRYIHLKKRKKINLRLQVFLLASLVYSILYFVWLPYIPIAHIFAGGSVVEAVIQRLHITHGLASLEPPFLFRFWRNVLQYFLPIAFLILLARRRYFTKSRTNIILIFALFLYISFCLTFTLEKASFVYFLVSIFFVLSMVERDKILNYKGILGIFNGKLLVIFTFSLLALMVFYEKFMGDSDITYIFSRIFRQTASNYLQMQYFDELGALGISGLDSKLLNFFGGESRSINFSKMAIEEMYPANRAEDVSGAAGGMFGTNLIFIFGYYGAPLIFLYCLALGALDKIFINSVLFQKSEELKIILVAFYSVFVVWYSMRAMSSPLTIFSVDYFLNPSFIILLLTLYFFSYFGLSRYK